MKPQFTPEALFTQIEEAVTLAVSIEELGPESEEAKIFIYRWAVVADEVSGMMSIASETLDEEALQQLKDQVNTKTPGRWESLRTGGRLNTLTQGRLYEGWLWPK